MTFDPATQFHLHLRDGTPVLVRSMKPDDRDRIAEAFRRLSPESRYFRFWTRFRELNPRFIEELCSPDQMDHVGWVMIHPDRDDIPGLGGGSFWRLADRPDTAEASFTVADEFQGRGVGTLLLAVLWEHARFLGIRQFMGRVLDSNLTMRAWWDALGATAIQVPRGWEMTLLLDEGLLEETHAAASLRHWLHVLRNRA